MKFKNIENIFSDKIYKEFLLDYSQKIKEKGYTVNNGTFLSFYNLRTSEQIENVINNNLLAIQKFEAQGKSQEYIQEFLDTNYYIFYECLPSEVKENVDGLMLVSKLYNEKNALQKETLIQEIKKITDSGGLIDLKNTQKYLSICLEDKVIIENKKLAMVLKGLPIAQVFILQKDLDAKKETSKKKAYLNILLEKKNKVETKNEKDKHIYNQEYYDFIKDERLAKDKIDTIKHAYFQNGIDLEEFKKDLGEELYKCSNDQLENYVEVYTRYKDSYLSKEEFFFSKKVIHEDYITQEEIKKDVLPVIEDYDLTERQIKECIAIGSNREKGDTKTYLDLCVEAKEHNYSNIEINELLDDCKDKPVLNAYYKTEMIKEYGNDNLTSVENLTLYTEKEMENLLKEKELALELNNLPEELTHERIGIELT